MENIFVQMVGNSLMVTIPKEIAEKLGIDKGASLMCGVDLICGEYAVYYMRMGKNINHKG